MNVYGGLGFFLQECGECACVTGPLFSRQMRGDVLQSGQKQKKGRGGGGGNIPLSPKTLVMKRKLLLKTRAQQNRDHHKEPDRHISSVKYSNLDNTHCPTTANKHC